MMTNILLKRSFFVKRLLFNFTSREEILKTYLEIIPPYKFLQIVEQKTGTLEQIVSTLQSLTKVVQPSERLEVIEESSMVDNKIVSSSQISPHLKSLKKYVKRKSDLIPMPMLIRILRLSCGSDDMRDIYLKLVRQTKFNAQNLPIEQLVQFVYELVKNNKKEYELMKEVEKVIIEEPIPLNYSYIRKMLWAYTQTNVGSPILYTHISKTLTVGQHELHPLELAEAAYLLSKVSENAKGGYGIFSLAQNHLQAYLPRLSFGELVKAASFLLTQNIGSNAFQVKLEAALYKQYPAHDRLKIKDMVTLLKATSGYFFKDNSLLLLLKTSTLKLTHHAKLEQLEDIIWSWGRLGKGDKEVWHQIQKCVQKHLKEFKPRQLAFAYHALCSTPHTSLRILSTLEAQFIQLQLESINQHYLIKFLLGMHRKKMYSNTVFTKISNEISKRIEKLSNSELSSFLSILNESDIDYSNKKEISFIIEAIEKASLRLANKLYTMKLTEITELAYLWTKLELPQTGLLEKCLLHLSNVMDIPKSSFIKAFFVFTMNEHYEKGVQFLPLIQQLTKYGPIGYFFSPYEFPLLAYCVILYHTKGNVEIDKKLLQQVKDALKKINPIILNPFVQKGYQEAIRLADEE